MSNRKYFLLSITLLFLTGCAAWPMNTSHVPEVKNIKEPEIPVYRPPKVAEGSLWSEIGGIDFFQDRRARRVGDLLTVRIVEDPEAELKANTKTSKSSSIAAKLKFLGYMKHLANEFPGLPDKVGEDELIKGAFDSSFKGAGSSDRGGHVKAYVSAVVVAVLPNGNLYINGKREIKVNNETQYITLSGIVRPEDISPTNEISSTYVANAKIAYSGIGPVSDKQKPGWLGRIIDHVWPF